MVVGDDEEADPRPDAAGVDDVDAANDGVEPSEESRAASDSASTPDSNSAFDSASASDSGSTSDSNSASGGASTPTEYRTTPDDEPDDEDGSDDRTRVTRREALAYAGGAGVGLGGWQALHNVVLGYGVVSGTNVVEQDLEPLLAEDLAVRYTAFDVGTREIRLDDSVVGVYEDDEFQRSLRFADATPRDARAVDEALGLPGAPLERLLTDLSVIRNGEFRFALSQTDRFFELIAAGDPRPEIVEALRGSAFDVPDPAVVGEFTDVDPAAVEPLIGGLADAFREHSYYDVPRYVAGSIEDNILLGAIDLRQYFRSPTDFEALATGENSGLFCTELAARAIEAFHAVPAAEQSAPVVAGFVSDQRHKHAYTVLASAIREDGDLLFPVTFLDYTHSTLYDDVRLTGVLGEGLEGYDRRHRATYVRWNRYPRI